MSTDLQNCPGCAGTDFSARYVLTNQPAVLNYRFQTADEARRVPRGDVSLRECQGCGLIFNAAFDPALIPYDERYENRQNCSPAFREHLERLADGLIERHRLRNGKILEVGCGKGDFLRLLCERAGAAGVGYDTTYEPVSRAHDERVSFHRNYVTADDVAGSVDAVICRHVVEHVPAIGDFLIELRRIAEAAGDPIVVWETPDFEWVARNGCFWDVFYEHCNYFTRPTLRFLAGRAGFRVERQETVFGGQYQLLELRVDRAASLLPPSVVPAVGCLAQFAKTAGEARERLEARLLVAGAAQGWAIWGAGAKGVALATQLARKPAFLVDSNPAKQGCVVPGSDIPIVSPGDPRVLEIPVLLVVNPNYATEVKEALAARGFGHTLLAL